MTAANRSATTPLTRRKTLPYLCRLIPVRLLLVAFSSKWTIHPVENAPSAKTKNAAKSEDPASAKFKRSSIVDSRGIEMSKENKGTQIA